MKRIKMSLANIQGKMSRSEMRNIMAGSGGCCYTIKYYGNIKICDVSQYDAISSANYWASQGYRSYWCCASC